MFDDSATAPSIWASMNSWFTPAVLFVFLNLMIGTILFSSSLANQQPEEKQEQEGHQNDRQQPIIARSPSVLQRLKSINFQNFRSQSPPISNLFKQSLDSHIRNPPEQTHETQTHYLFEETHNQQEILNTDSQYVFEKSLEEKITGSLTQFVFEQSLEETTREIQTQFVHEETHVEEEEDGEPQSLDEVYSKLAQLADHHVSRTTSDTKPASGEVPEKLPQKMRKSASLKSPFGHFEESDIVDARRPATVRERSSRVNEADEEVDAKADDFINKFKQQLKLQRLDSIIRYKEVISRGSAK